MNKSDYVKSISEGAINYLRILGKSKNMIYHKSDIEWIAPQVNTPGPALVFNTTLTADNADQRIKQILPEIAEKNIPSCWFITPIATPDTIADILIQNGFPDTRVSDDAEDGEPGMALNLDGFVRKPLCIENLRITELSQYDELCEWILIVNKVLHGWDMLLAENCRNLLLSDEVTLYLAYQDDIPVATAATMKYGNDASLEFISTKKEYQRKGIGTAICIKALNDLKKQGVRTVTLRSSAQAKKLYGKLGFIKYFNTTMLCYKGTEGEIT